jgi:hypothetical protein
MAEKAARASLKAQRVRIENVNHPGSSTSVDARPYSAMREALLAVLPDAAPGLTESQMRDAVASKLPEDLFPGGARIGWWSKAVQLDLEAKGLVARELGRPLRWHRPAEPVRAALPHPPRTPGATFERSRTRSTFPKS